MHMSLTYIVKWGNFLEGFDKQMKGNWIRLQDKKHHSLFIHAATLDLVQSVVCPPIDVHSLLLDSI